MNQDAPRRRHSDGGENPARSIEREEPVPLHRDSEGISPDIAARRRGPHAERAVDDATRDPRPDQAVAAPRDGCASRRGSRTRPRRARPPKAKPADFPVKKACPRNAITQSTCDCKIGTPVNQPNGWAICAAFLRGSRRYSSSRLPTAVDSAVLPVPVPTGPRAWRVERGGWWAATGRERSGLTRPPAWHTVQPRSCGMG